MIKETENKEAIKIETAKVSSNELGQIIENENSVATVLQHKYMEHLKSIGGSVVKAVDTSIRLVLLGKVDEEAEEVASKSRGPIIFGLWVSILTLFVGGGWMCFAPLNSASHSTGLIVLESNKHTVQIMDDGIVDQVLVKTGDIVTKGQPLIIALNAQIKAKHDSLQSYIYQLEATENRLAAEHNNVDSVDNNNSDAIIFDEDLLAKANQPEIAKILDTQRKLFISRKEAVTAQLSAFTEQMGQFKKSIEGSHAQELALREQIKSATESLNAAKKLLASGNMDRTRFIERESRLSSLTGSHGEQVSRQAALTQQISETAMRMASYKAEKLNESIKELKQTEAQLSEARENYKAAADSLGRSTIKAPNDGIVNNVDKTLSVGSNIYRGSTIMEIIPQNDKLVVDAKVSPNNIDNVHLGMLTKINVSAFKTRNLPPIMGKVVRVSPDLVIDRNAPQMGGFFEVRIEVDQDSLDYIEKKYRKLNLQTGMMADVTIINGTRTMMQYLLSPITDTFKKAFTEK